MNDVQRMKTKQIGLVSSKMHGNLGRRGIFRLSVQRGSERAMALKNFEWHLGFSPHVSVHKLGNLLVRLCRKPRRQCQLWPIAGRKIAAAAMLAAAWSRQCTITNRDRLLKTCQYNFVHDLNGTCLRGPKNKISIT